MCRLISGIIDDPINLFLELGSDLISVLFGISTEMLFQHRVNRYELDHNSLVLPKSVSNGSQSGQTYCFWVSDWYDAFLHSVNGNSEEMSELAHSPIGLATCPLLSTYGTPPPPLCQ
jgi:hypothetical protein